MKSAPFNIQASAWLLVISPEQPPETSASWCHKATLKLILWFDVDTTETQITDTSDFNHTQSIKTTQKLVFTDVHLCYGSN